MKCNCGGKTQVLDRRGEYRRRECLKCKNRFSTKEIVVVRARNKTQPKKRKAPAPMAKNTREQVTKNASARRLLEERRDIKKDGLDDL